MENFYVSVLEKLYPYGIDVLIDISDTLHIKFIKDGITDIHERNQDIELYLHVFIKNKHISNYVSKYDTAKNGTIIIIARISLEGFNFISDLKQDKSVLLTNATVIRNSKQQNLILWATIVIGIINVIVSVLTYLSTQDTPHRASVLPIREQSRGKLLKLRPDPEKNIKLLQKKP